MKQYKAVAGPKSINVAKGDTQAAFNSFANLINQQATDGWEFSEKIEKPELILNSV